MSDSSYGLFHQPLHIIENVLNCHFRDLALAFQFDAGASCPFFLRDLRKIASVTQQIVDDENARLIYALFYGFVTTKSTLLKWEGKWLKSLGSSAFFWCGL